MTPTLNDTPPAESPLTFPCEFPIKVMGRREDGFAQVVADIVGRHVPGLSQEAIEMRASSNARFLSVTVTFEAQSREQLDALYTELSKHPMVMMVL